MEMKDLMKKLIVQMERMDVEIATLREEKETQAKEIANLRSRFENRSTDSLEGWMKVQLENMKTSSDLLNAKTAELFKNICEKGAARSHSTYSSDRKRLTDEMQKLEDLCVEIWKDVTKTNAEHVMRIASHLSITETSTKQSSMNARFKNDVAVDSFLGTYILREKERVPYIMYHMTGQDSYRTISIRKVDQDGKYQMCYKLEKGGQVLSAWWIPDNIERDGRRVCIEANILKYHVEPYVTVFELRDICLKVNGSSFIRV